MCVHCTVHSQLLHTILHRTDLVIFPLTLQTITIAPTMSNSRPCFSTRSAGILT